MAINKAMIEDESGDKNIDTIVEDNLQTLLPVKTHLQEEIIDEGRKIIESTEITPPPLVHPEALTSPLGLNTSNSTTTLSKRKRVTMKLK